MIKPRSRIKKPWLMMNRMTYMLLALGLGSMNIQAEPDVYQITAEQWAIPRHGESVLKMSALQNLLSHWQQDVSRAIEISYPGGEQGELWLRELQDWLIALGVPSASIKSVAGSGGKDLIKLSVLKTGGSK